MASKTEYYDRVLASLQSELTSQKSEISELRSTVSKQQKEIYDLKASQDTRQKPSIPQQVRIDVEALLREVKRVCDNAILAKYEHLPTMFAERQEFESFCKSAGQKFLLADTFTDYKKSLEARLKSIEERLGQGFCLLAINFCEHKRDKGYRSILSGLRNLKDIEFEGFLPFVIFLFLCMVAVYLIGSITT